MKFPTAVKLIGLATMVTVLALRPTNGTAQVITDEEYDPNAYWSGYWDWYDAQYVPASHWQGHPAGRGDMPPQPGDGEVFNESGYLGESPAISGAPNAGGNYDDYPAGFYVPNGITQFYGRGNRIQLHTPVSDHVPNSLRDNDSEQIPESLRDTNPDEGPEYRINPVTGKAERNRDATVSETPTEEKAAAGDTEVGIWY